MSFLSDVFGFEKENLSDIWRKVKKNPERLLIGAADPWSSKLWSKITGKDYEPLVDQMGGAYGGHTISAFGNTDGGAYARAEAKGIDTKAGATMQDVAHVIAAMYAGGYGSDKLGGMFQSGEGSQPWANNIPSSPGDQQQTTPEQPRRPAMPRTMTMQSLLPPPLTDGGGPSVRLVDALRRRY